MESPSEAQQSYASELVDHINAGKKIIGKFPGPLPIGTRFDRLHIEDGESGLMDHFDQPFTVKCESSREEFEQNRIGGGGPSLPHYPGDCYYELATD